MPGPEFPAGGALHRTRDLHAYSQFKLLRAVIPALPALSAMQAGQSFAGSWGAAMALAPLEAASDADIAAAFDACAACCERQDGGTWGPATKAMPLADVLHLVMAAVDAHLGDYLAMRHPQFSRTTGQIPQFEPVEMPEGEGWFWEPCSSDPPLLPMTAATDYVHRLWHFAKANDILSVRTENEARARKAVDKK